MEHARLRKLVKASFAPVLVESMDQRIQRLVDALLDSAAEAPAMNFVHAIAYPLPATVIAEVLGIPVEDHHRFAPWSLDVAAVASAGTQPSPSHLRQCQRSVLEMVEFLKPLMAARRAHPQNDMISVFARAEDEGGVTGEEALANFIMMLFAGHLSTTRAMAAGMHHLLEHREQLDRLREDPTRVRPAVEEILRLYAAPALRPRIALEPVEIGGVKLERGQRVMVALACANHDPREFPLPEVFDPTRNPNHHLSFGAGHKMCIGAWLSRLQMKIVYSTIIRRFPELRLDENDPPQWYTFPPDRVLLSLPTVLRPD
jgi:cytochrome P450